MKNRSKKRLLHRAIVVAGAIALTLAFFLVLPFVQAIGKSPVNDVELRQLDVALPPPPPPPPPEDQPEDEPEPEEKPPELQEETQPLDLSQLELALSAGGGGGWMTGDFTVKLDNVAGASNDVAALFSLAELDQKPRATYQTSPVMSAAVRRKAPGHVVVIFVVDEDGKVREPLVQSSTDPIFENPALAAIKKWRFEPGKRNGQAVQFRMRQQITFPAKR